MLIGKTFFRVLVLLVALFSTQAWITAADNGQDKTALVARHLPKVHLEAWTIEEILAHISLRYDVPIALEEIARIETSEKHKLDFNGGSLKKLFDQLLNTQTGYAWKVEQGIISVYPTDNSRDAVLSELLDTQISHFSIEPGTSCWTVKKSLFAAPELRRALETRALGFDAGTPGGFYIPQVGKQFSLEVSNTNLRAILNRIIRESPVAKMWSFKRDTSGGTLLLSLKANLEVTA